MVVMVYPQVSQVRQFIGLVVVAVAIGNFLGLQVAMAAAVMAEGLEVHPPQRLVQLILVVVEVRRTVPDTVHPKQAVQV
jgi:hypothetical protein